VAERVFAQVEGFSGFGFPKSHACAFALLAYQSTWLRVHYGPELLCSLLNEQPMGFYPADSLVHEAQRRGIEVRGPDVNRSEAECTVEADGAPGASTPPVRIGLGYIAGLPEEEARALVSERRRSGPYTGLEELASRSGIGRDGLERLTWAGACEGLEGDERRRSLWRMGVARGAARRRRARQAQLSLPLPLPAAPELRPLDAWERMVADYRSTGMTLGTHPMALLSRLRASSAGGAHGDVRHGPRSARTPRGRRAPGRLPDREPEHARPTRRRRAPHRASRRA
jgi:error-prone DNA polymerase